MADAPSNLPEFSVSELSASLKRIVEDAFSFVRVRGEISGLKFHSSGHVYFDLKDEKAVLNAVVWKGAVRALKIRPEAGLEVICTGRITTYAGASRYQLIVEQMELAGVGALMAMLEARKQKLAAEGLFDSARKKPLPFLPAVIGVVTSPTGAVIRDIMHRLNDRFPSRVLLWPVAVQGEKAPAEIAAAIDGFAAFPQNGLPRPDVLIVGRGGGSLEDLMAFNEEVVVRAAARCPIPLISAVGHETDVTLMDFAADMRAPTPTAAAEMAVPVRADLLGQVLDFERRLIQATHRGVIERKDRLERTGRLLPAPERLLAPTRQRLDTASERLNFALQGNLHVHRRRYESVSLLLRPATLKKLIAAGLEKIKSLDDRMALAERMRLAELARKLEAVVRLLDSVSHRAVLSRGFALVQGADGTLRRTAASLKTGEKLTLLFADGPANVISDGRPVRGRGKAKAETEDENQGNLF